MITAAETPEQIEAVADLAREIWREHYTPIIGEAQVSYMLAKFQSAGAIERQIGRDGARYYLIGDNEGYLGFEVRGETLFLSKIYVLGPKRGSGLGQKAFEFVTGEAAALGCKKIELTVNRGNAAAFAAYERWGLSRTGEVVTDIGGGYVMDDYVYEYPVGR